MHNLFVHLLKLQSNYIVYWIGSSMCRTFYISQLCYCILCQPCPLSYSDKMCSRLMFRCNNIFLIKLVFAFYGTFTMMLESCFIYICHCDICHYHFLYYHKYIITCSVSITYFLWCKNKVNFGAFDLRTEVTL